MSHEKYQECIEKCNECATIFDYYATESLHEKDIKMLVRCIELDRVCAEACRSAAAIMSQGSEFASRFCELCADICQACGDECNKHKHMEHCK